MHAFEVKAGLRLHFRDEQWTVEGAPGARVCLRNSLGRTQDFDLTEVLSDSTFFPIVPEHQVHLYDPRSIILDTFPDALKRSAVELEEHILEYATGYRSGNPQQARADEPREAYDPNLYSVSERLKHKAEELVGLRDLQRLASRHPSPPKKRVKNDPVDAEMERLRKLRRNHQHLGLIGLVDRRKLRQLGGAGRNHPEVVAEAHKVASKQVRESNRTRVNLAMSLRHRIEDRKGTIPPLQSESSLRRLVKYVGKLKRLHNSAPTRRSLANRPARVYQGVVATRPGEYMLMDVSPGDFLAIDPITLQAARYKVVIGMCLQSRSVASARLLRYDPAGIDLSFTLYDIITPKRMMPGWPATALYPYVGIPQHVVLRIHGLPEDTELAGLPFVVPQNVVIDNGSNFKSAHFRNVCQLLGISIIYSRPYTPTDKPQIERFFRTFETGFAQHYDSYVGSNVAERGEELEQRAVHFASEIESRLGEWIATVYQRQQHSELRHRDVPGALFSPNDMYDIGMKEAGMITVPFGRDIYYQLLETIHRKINDYGVQSNYLYYDHPELQDLRNVPSSFAHLKGQHPFKRDPRDLRYLYFKHPTTGKWLRLERKLSGFPEAPFTAELLRRARLMALKQGGQLHDPAEVGKALDALVRGIRSETPSKRKRLKELREQQKLLQSAEDQRTVMPDTAMSAPVASPVPVNAPSPSPQANTYSTLDQNDDWAADFDFSTDLN